MILNYSNFKSYFESPVASSGGESLEKLSSIVKIIENSNTLDEMLNSITDSIMNGDYTPERLKYYYRNSELYQGVANTDSVIVGLKSAANLYRDLFYRINRYMQHLFYIKNYLESLGTGSGMKHPMISEYIDRKYKDAVFPDSGKEISSFLKENYSKDDYEVLSQEEDNIKIIKLAKQKYNEEISQYGNRIREILVEMEKIDRNFTFLNQKCDEIQNKAGGSKKLRDTLQEYLWELYSKYKNVENPEIFAGTGEQLPKFALYQTEFTKKYSDEEVPRIDVYKFMGELDTILEMYNKSTMRFDKKINDSIGKPEEFLIRKIYDEYYTNMRELQKDIYKANAICFIMKAADYQNKMKDDFLTLKELFLSGRRAESLLSIPFDQPNNRIGYSDDILKNKFYNLPSDEFNLYKYTASSLADGVDSIDRDYSSDNRIADSITQRRIYGFRLDNQFLTKEEMNSLYEYVLQQIKI